MKKDDLLIAMFRIGKAQISNGITREEMISKLRKDEIEGAFSNSTHCSGQFERYWGQFFEHDRAGGWESERMFLNWRGYLELTKHEELEQARKSSKTSLWVAIAAIVISAVLSIVQIYFHFQTTDVEFVRPQSVKIEGVPTVMVKEPTQRPSLGK